MGEDKNKAGLSGFGRALRLLREAAALTQGALASRTGQAVRKSQISSYENERARPTLESLGALLDALGVDFAELQRAIDLAQSAPESSPGRLAGALELRSQQQAGSGVTEEEPPAFLVLDLRPLRRQADPERVARAVKDYVHLSRAVLERIEAEEAKGTASTAPVGEEGNGE